MAYNTHIPIIYSGLIMSVDALNLKSNPDYTNTLVYDLGKDLTPINLQHGISFDGVSFQLDDIGSQYIYGDSTNEPNGFNKYTFSIWINNVTNTGGIFNYWDLVSGGGIELELYFGDIYIAFTGSDYGTYNYTTTEQWVNLTFTFDGDQVGNSNMLKFYINGEPKTLDFTGSVPSVISYTSAVMQVGMIDTGIEQRYLKCSVSNFMSYNRTLSDVEVMWNYNALKNRFI